MDKLANRLREDAAKIESPISDALDRRITASLQGIAPEPPRRPPGVVRPLPFWLASGLTGVAAAFAMIAIINLQRPEPPRPDVVVETAPMPDVPVVRWHAKTAVLTAPLEQEIEDLQSDMKKAEEAVRQDIDRLF